MRNILEALNATPDGGSKLNPFDLGNFETFHQKGGVFNVVGVRDTVPDSDYRMSVDAVTRSLLCNTANFARMKENFYFIHVPLGLISRNAYMMQVQRKQNYSALDMSIAQMPVFSLGTVLKEIFRISMFNMDRSDITYGPTSQDWDAMYFDEHGFNIAYGAVRLFDNLGFGYFGDILEALNTKDDLGNRLLSLDEAKKLVDPLVSMYPSVSRLGAYQCAWYNFFRNDIYDNDVPATCFNFDDITLKSTYNSPTEPNYVVDQVRGVTRFVLECCRLRYNPLKKDIFTASMPGTQWGAVSTVNLLTDLDFDTNAVNFETATGGYPTLPSNTAVVNGQSGLGYVSVLPPDSQSGEYGRLVTDYAPNEGVQVGLGISHKHSATFPSQSLSIPSGTSLFDVLSLVEAQAIQKWRQKSMMAGNRTKDNWRAHYGVVPKHLQEHLPDFIGSVDNELFVKEITSQANTLDAADGENNLGEIRGRAYGASDTKTFRFHSNDFGVLLLIHAIVPENTYSSFGLDKGNTMIFPTDFAQPEYENIGLDVVPKFIADVLSSDNIPSVTYPNGTDNFLDTYNRGAFGMANRNFHLKQYPSKVHGLFNPTRLFTLANNKYGVPVISEDNIFGYADMQSFVLTRDDLVAKIGAATNDGNVSVAIQRIAMTLSKIYVNPRLFDSIFAVSADDFMSSDVFFTHLHFRCESMLPMSVLGLPKF